MPRSAGPFKRPQVRCSGQLHGQSHYCSTCEYLTPQAVQVEWNRLQRGTATLTYQLALGRPELMPELTYTLQGVKAEIDAIIWYGGNVQHSLTADGGYTTRLELEARLPEDLIADLVDEIRGDCTGIIAYYRDPKTGKEHTLTEGDQSKPRRLRHLYATKATAKRAVEREWERLRDSNT